MANPAAAPSPQPETVARRPVVVHGSPRWIEWLDQVAEASRLSRSAMLDKATAEYARMIGHDEPPPPRY